MFGFFKNYLEGSRTEVGRLMKVKVILFRLGCGGSSGIDGNLSNSGTIVKLEATELVDKMWERVEKYYFKITHIIYMYVYII